MTGRPQVATEGVGGVPSRMETNQPMQSQGGVSGQSPSNITVPNNLKGLSAVEYQKLTNVATAKGLKSDAITDLYDELGLKTVQNLLKQSDDEIAAALKAVQLEKLDGGHSIARHGPQLEDRALEDRLTKGVTPDNRIQNAPPASTSFNNFKDWEKTREIAFKEIEKKFGIDLTKPPAPGQDPAPSITIEYDRPIDDGYLGVNGKSKITNPQTGKKIKVYNNTQQIDGVNRTFTRINWDSSQGKWISVQHFPVGKNWNQSSQTYTGGTPADVNVTLL